MNLIDQAVATIEKRGWCQGEYFSAAPNLAVDPGKGSCCVIGALGCTHARNTGEQDRALDAVCDEVESRGYDLEFGEVSLTHWNDEDHRTKDEVLDVLRAASRRLSSR